MEHPKAEAHWTHPAWPLRISGAGGSGDGGGKGSSSVTGATPMGSTSRPLGGIVLHPHPRANGSTATESLKYPSQMFSAALRNELESQCRLLSTGEIQHALNKSNMLHVPQCGVSKEPCRAAQCGYNCMPDFPEILVYLLFIQQLQALMCWEAALARLMLIWC